MPALTQHLFEATTNARQTQSFAPLRAFVHSWAVFVVIERHPQRAARLRELERIVDGGEQDPADAIAGRRRRRRRVCERLDLGLQPERGVHHRRVLGLPPGVVAEVERLATELAALGPDSVDVARPVDREGGLREFDLLGGRGFSFLAMPRHACVYVCNITWYG